MAATTEQLDTTVQSIIHKRFVENIDALDGMLAESPSFSSPVEAETWLSKLESLIEDVRAQPPPDAPKEAAAFKQRLASAQDFARVAHQELLTYLLR
jgi:hypothetical protein